MVLNGKLFFGQDAYMKILPLYFPRSSQEEVDAIKLLPEDIGNENGEPIIQGTVMIWMNLNRR